jgi:hypothetical protein
MVTIGFKKPRQINSPPDTSGNLKSHDGEYLSTGYGLELEKVKKAALIGEMFSSPAWLKHEHAPRTSRHDRKLACRWNYLCLFAAHIA